MKTVLTYALFIAFVVMAGLLSGLTNMPGEWYRTLEKPFFNPPSWVFGPVWTILYVLIGIAGARIWQLSPRSAAMQVWFAQFALNMLWSPAFFGMQSPALGLVVIFPLLASVLVFIAKARRIDPLSSWLFVPYAAWVGFATVLNATLFLMN